MLILRWALRINLKKEEDAFRQDLALLHPRLETLNLRITNPNLEGMKLGEIPGLAGSGVVISRIQSCGNVHVAKLETVLHFGDILLAVGPPSSLESLRVVAGETSEVDLRAHSGELSVRRVVVTRKAAIGASLADLALETLHNVRFTRLSRSEIDLPDPLNRRLQAGDTLTVVGDEGSLDLVAKGLGNSMKDLNHPQIIPLFVGIVLGIVLGSIPIFVPSMPAPVKLGLAGGPLLVAILLSHIGRIGPMVWYMPVNANFLLREIGIVMFLSVVGIKSGGKFMETLLEGDGLLWLGCGAAITLLPLLVMGLIGRVLLRQNYLGLIGVLAGSMTDPPALAFANSITTTPAPALSYATVYPLTMLLRVVAVQILVLAFG
jgi:putative transport protein